MKTRIVFALLAAHLGDVGPLQPTPALAQPTSSQAIQPGPTCSSAQTSSDPAQGAISSSYSQICAVAESAMGGSGPPPKSKAPDPIAVLISKATGKSLKEIDEELDTLLAKLSDQQLKKRFSRHELLAFYACREDLASKCEAAMADLSQTAKDPNLRPYLQIFSAMQRALRRQPGETSTGWIAINPKHCPPLQNAKAGQIIDCPFIAPYEPYFTTGAIARLSTKTVIYPFTSEDTVAVSTRTRFKVIKNDQGERVIVEHPPAPGSPPLGDLIHPATVAVAAKMGQNLEQAKALIEAELNGAELARLKGKLTRQDLFAIAACGKYFDSNCASAPPLAAAYQKAIVKLQGEETHDWVLADPGSCPALLNSKAGETVECPELKQATDPNIQPVLQVRVRFKDMTRPYAGTTQRVLVPAPIKILKNHSGELLASADPTTSDAQSIQAAGGYAALVLSARLNLPVQALNHKLDQELAKPEHAGLAAKYSREELIALFACETLVKGQCVDAGTPPKNAPPFILVDPQSEIPVVLPNLFPKKTGLSHLAAIRESVIKKIPAETKLGWHLIDLTSCPELNQAQAGTEVSCPNLKLLAGGPEYETLRQGLARVHTKAIQVPFGASDTTSVPLSGRFKVLRNQVSSEMIVSEISEGGAPNPELAKLLKTDTTVITTPTPQPPAGNSYEFGLTPNEYEAIAYYKGTGYTSINTALRSEGEPNEATKRRIKDLDQALEKVPTYRGWVARGAGTLPPAVLAQHCLGCIVEYKAYTSTSYEIGFIQGHRFLIYTSKRGRKIDTLALHQGEKEVLIQRGTKFKVLAKVPRNGTNSFFTFVMEEVE